MTWGCNLTAINALRSQYWNKNVSSSRLNCSKLISVCLRCSECVCCRTLWTCKIRCLKMPYMLQRSTLWRNVLVNIALQIEVQTVKT